MIAYCSAVGLSDPEGHVGGNVQTRCPKAVVQIDPALAAHRALVQKGKQDSICFQAVEHVKGRKKN